MGWSLLALGVVGFAAALVMVRTGPPRPAEDIGRWKDVALGTCAAVAAVGVWVARRGKRHDAPPRLFFGADDR